MSSLNSIQLNYNDTQGHYLTAKQSITQSNLVFQSTLYQHSIYLQYKKRVCAYCLHYTPHYYTIHCTQCNILYYCSDVCQHSDIHTSEQCEIYSKLSSCKYRDDNNTLAVIKLVCDIYLNEYNNNPSTNTVIDNDPHVIDLTNIQFNGLVYHNKPEYTEIATYIAHNILNNNNCTIQTIEHIIGRIEANSFALYAENDLYDVPDRRKHAYTCLQQSLKSTEESKQSDIDTIQSHMKLQPCIEVGKSMYLTASMFNHSCQPTCSVIHYNNTLHIYANTDIQINDELSISYIDTNDSVNVRQSKLLELYNFKCQCKRCITELHSMSRTKTKSTGLFSMKSLLRQAKRIDKQPVPTPVTNTDNVHQYVHTPFTVTPLTQSINANDYVLPNINQVRYIPNVITPTDESLIVQQIQQTPSQCWTQLRNRRLQQWGGTVTTHGLTQINTIPQYMQQCIQRIKSLNIFTAEQQPNHVLLNQYNIKQGISPHKDGPLYTPIVTILSLNSTVMLKFYNTVPNGSQMNHHVFSVLCEPCSVIVFNNDVYTNMWHAIDMTDVDIIDERVVNRHLLNKQYQIGDMVNRDDTRYSLTIRHVPVASANATNKSM